MDWVVGHIKPRAIYPELTWEPSNWRVEHRTCSNKTGQSVVIEKAKRDALASVGYTTNTNTDFSPAKGPKESPPLPACLPGLSVDVEEVPVHLRWDRKELSRHEWLRPLLDIPEDASAPLMMSPVPDDAVGSYGWDAIEWIEESQRLTLRWWQRLSLVRQLEHRADGTLCFAKKVESAPRRAGKSVGLKGGVLWRLAKGPELFGEVQTAIHTGSDMAICREIQRSAWRWSEEVAGWVVTRANGKESIETSTGDRWLVRAQDAVYGYDLMLGLVDEAWDVKVDVVSEGLEPAMLERKSPQLILTSTAHRRATSLMRGEIASAKAGDDPTALLLLWAAPDGADPGDPETWRAASPHWSEDRRKMIASKYKKALAGEDDKEFDDPDPLRGFCAQYLNQWSIRERKAVGSPIVSDEDWASLATERPGGPPDACAVESWFDSGVSVALAWKPRVEGGPVVVAVEDYPSLPAAAAAVKASGVTRPALVGAALLKDEKVWRDARASVSSISGATRSVVADAVRLLNERAFLHADSPELSDQVLTMRVSPGTDGPRIRTTGRADALKAATWAAQAARKVPVRKTSTKIIMVDW